MRIMVKITQDVKDKQNCKKCMFSRNLIYLLPRERSFPHISGYHDHISRYKSNIFKLNELYRRDKISVGAMPSPKILSLTVSLEKLSDILGSVGENRFP